MRDFRQAVQVTIVLVVLLMSLFLLVASAGDAALAGTWATKAAVTWQVIQKKRPVLPYCSNSAVRPCLSRGIDDTWVEFGGPVVSMELKVRKNRVTGSITEYDTRWDHRQPNHNVKILNGTVEGGRITLQAAYESSSGIKIPRQYVGEMSSDGTLRIELMTEGGKAIALPPPILLSRQK